MSYFNVDYTNQEMINEESEDITMNSTPISTEKKKRDHRGEKNPHFGHIMTQESKNKISKSQSERYEMIRKLVRKGMAQPMNEDRVRQICNEVVDNYFKKNSTRVDDNKSKQIEINL